jgi:hypothetical protein
MSWFFLGMSILFVKIGIPINYLFDFSYNSMYTSYNENTAGMFKGRPFEVIKEYVHRWFICSKHSISNMISF